MTAETRLYDTAKDPAAATRRGEQATDIGVGAARRDFMWALARCSREL